MNINEFNRINLNQFPCPEILFCPNTPKPLHGLTPRTILGKSWWDEQRKLAYALYNYHCHACGIHKSKAKYHQHLEAHELYYFDYPNGRLKLRAVVGLCHSCHNYIHDGRMSNLVNEGLFDPNKMDDILEHGQSILFDAGYALCKIDLDEEDIGDLNWRQWHIILEGQTYYARYESYKQWRDYYKYLNSNSLKDSPENWKNWAEGKTELPRCPYCNGETYRADSSLVYDRNYGTKVIVCRNYPACDSFVGCHKDGQPKGSLANKQLREWRKRVHGRFDFLWKSGRMSRDEAYSWLSEQMGLPEAHIGFFTLEQCQQAIQLVEQYQRSLR